MSTAAPTRTWLVQRNAGSRKVVQLHKAVHHAREGTHKEEARGDRAAAPARLPVAGVTPLATHCRHRPGGHADQKYPRRLLARVQLAPVVALLGVARDLLRLVVRLGGRGCRLVLLGLRLGPLRAVVKYLMGYS